MQHIVRFYRNYHSSRYVRDDLVIRMHKPLRAEDVEKLRDEFRVLIKEGGSMSQVLQPLDGEDEHHGLPRLVFKHTKHKFGLIRRLIDRINDMEPAPTTDVPPPTLLVGPATPGPTA